LRRIDVPKSTIFICSVSFENFTGWSSNMFSGFRSR
jgi:hypothetical protein